MYVLQWGMIYGIPVQYLQTLKILNDTEEFLYKRPRSPCNNCLQIHKKHKNFYFKLQDLCSHTTPVQNYNSFLKIF